MTVTQPQPPDLGAADQALKEKHRAMWALGNYDAVATEIIADLGPVLVQAAGISSRHRVLDVAAGSGNVAIPAARTGAQVTASDLTPELLAIGERRAAAAGLALRWEAGDAEALPYADGEFDAVLSCVGVMFAPHHQADLDAAGWPGCLASPASVTAGRPPTTARCCGRARWSGARDSVRTTDGSSCR